MSSSSRPPIRIDAVDLPAPDLISFFGDFAEALVGEKGRVVAAGYAVGVDFYRIFEEGPRSGASSVFAYDKPTSKVRFSAELRQEDGNVALYGAPISKWGMAVVLSPLVLNKIKNRMKSAFRTAFTRALNKMQQSGRS